MPRQLRGDWSDHFSASAADLIRVCGALAGFDVKDILLRCFRRSKADRISERTVSAVLQELSDETKATEKALIAELETR